MLAKSVFALVLNRNGHVGLEQLQVVRDVPDGRARAVLAEGFRV